VKGGTLASANRAQAIGDVKSRERLKNDGHSAGSKNGLDNYRYLL